jgi:hypothetical protein
MILSLQVHYQKNLDLMAFFARENAILCPPDLWFETLCASLRLKHSILIYDHLQEGMPEIDPRHRWQTGDNWSWLSPRSLNVVSDAYDGNMMNYIDLKQFLKNSK